MVGVKNFKKSITASWQDMQMEKDFCDVTLSCENKEVRAHKIVLSSCSSVLESVLKIIETPHPLIYLNGIKFRYLQNLIHFMYQGKVCIVEEDLPDFLEIIKELGVKGLLVETTEALDLYGLSPRQKTNIVAIENINDNHFVDLVPESKIKLENESQENLVNNQLTKNYLQSVK